MILKVFIWPLDLKNFSGKCTFKLAFPGYPKALSANQSNHQNQNDRDIENIERSANRIEGLSPRHMNQLENVIGIYQNANRNSLNNRNAEMPLQRVTQEEVLNDLRIQVAMYNSIENNSYNGASNMGLIGIDDGTFFVNNNMHLDQRFAYEVIRLN